MAPATPGIDVAGLCADTQAILADWVETLTIQRATTTYDAMGQATQTWSVVDTFEGDWQAPDGKLIYDEAGQVVTHEGVVIGPCNLGIVVADRIVQSDTSYMEVVYVAVHEGHTTIYLKEPETGNNTTVILKPTEAGYKAEITSDTDVILADWHETLTVNRRASDDYDTEGVAQHTFAKLTTIRGDWHPIRGTLPNEETGNIPRSVAQVATRPDVTVQEDDQLVRSDSSVYYVNYVLWYEDHCTIRLKRTEGQET